MTSPMMNISSTSTNNDTNTCDSPSGSSTSEPHDEQMSSLQAPSFIDSSFFYKLDQLSPDNPLFFMQQQQSNNIQHLQHQQHLQQQQQSQQPSLSPSPNMSNHLLPTQSNFVDPLLPNNAATDSSNPTFWSGFNNVSRRSFSFYVKNKVLIIVCSNRLFQILQRISQIIFQEDIQCNNNNNLIAIIHGSQIIQLK